MCVTQKITSSGVLTKRLKLIIFSNILNGTYQTTITYSPMFDEYQTQSTKVLAMTVLQNHYWLNLVTFIMDWTVVIWFKEWHWAHLPGSSNPSPAPTSLTMPACNAGPMVESEEQEETTEDGIRCDRTTINVVVSTEVSGCQWWLTPEEGPKRLPPPPHKNIHLPYTQNRKRSICNRGSFT